MYVRFKTPQHVSPRAKKPRICAVLHGPDAAFPLNGSLNVHTVDSCDILCSFHASCGISVSQDAISVFGTHSATTLNLVDCAAVVMQRTCGGMNMFDVHVLPHVGDAVTVDNISHECLPGLIHTLGDLGINVGSDPVKPVRNAGGKWDLDALRCLHACGRSGRRGRGRNNQNCGRRRW